MIDVTAEPLPRLAPRRADGHKGDYGRVIVIGGSRGMAGAPSLTGVAALRSGAGTVTIATPGSAQPTVAALNPCYMTVPLFEDAYGIIDMANVVDLIEAKERFDVWAVGPGLGQSEGVAELVAQLYREIPRPMVVDADGLNALVAGLRRNPHLLEEPAGPRILTPHPGEFARLTGSPPPGDVHGRAEAAVELCRRDASGRTTVVLKVHRSIVAASQKFAVNSTGNPGMATGGTGDCLTGVVAALAGQQLDPWSAARLGAHVHGLAGDIAAEELGQVSLIASDLLNFLPQAFKSL
jgi:ADP-dependent NAD(P)H-hydrate dehydratase